MPDVTMQQNLNILLMSLGRTYPGAAVHVNAVGPLHITNGKVQMQETPTQTTVELGNTRRPALPEPPMSLAEIEAEQVAKEVTRSNRVAGMQKTRKRGKGRAPAE